MKTLCFGNTSADTDILVSKLAQENNSVNRGLVTKAEEIIEDAFYHTSIVDMSPLEISKLNCEIIILDQPKESYNDVREYYQTKALLNQGGYWKKLLEVNKSFCIFPFINMSTKHQDVTLCCRSFESIGKIQDGYPYKDYWKTSKAHSDVRAKLLKGEKIKNCESCYRTEEKLGTSDRITQTLDWADKLDLSTVNDINFDHPVMYDMFPNNNCNLMCRICSPVYSKLIAREYKELGLEVTDDNNVSTDWKYIDINTAQVVYIAGGEPTAMKEFYQFLQRCIKHKRTDIEIRINTNAHKISKPLFNLLEKFSNIVFTISVDGYGLANDYSRWLSDWDRLVDNCRKIRLQGHRLNFNIVTSIYTVFSLPKLLQWLDEDYKQCIVSIQYSGNINNMLTPFMFEYNQSILQEFEKVKGLDICKKNKNLVNFIENFISIASASKLNKNKLIEFFKFNDRLDGSRNSKLADYIPELAEKRKLVE